MKHFMENDTFGLYTAGIYYEWQQARDEGREVSHLENICKEIQKRFYSENRQDTLDDLELAYALEKEMKAAPVKEDYSYVEPSDLAAISAESRGQLKKTAVNDVRARDGIYGGWTGRIVGCLLGKPLEFWKFEQLNSMLRETENYPLRRYVSTEDFTPELIKKYNIKTGTPLIKQPWIDELEGYAPADDDTNYTVLNLKLMETFGYDFDPGDVLYGWTNWVPAGICCTAERIAYKNALYGLSAPQTSTFRNPFREWVGAQIRAEIFGWANPGDPEAAAEAAYRDACVSHVKNGIYGEMFAAAMVAQAFVTDNIREIIEAGLSVIPTRSRLYETVTSAMADHASGMSLESAMKKLHEEFDENNIFEWCHIIPNEKIVVLSLLYSEGDFSKAIGTCAQFAFDTDSNAAVVGAVMGTILGEKGIDEKWKAPINGRVQSTVLDEHMNRISDLAERTFRIAKRDIHPDERLKSRYDYNESFEVE